MTKLVSYDLETHCVQPGLLSPPIVCGSLAYRNREDLISGQLLTKAMALNDARVWLESDKTICGANIAYDFGCLIAEDASFLPLVFRKYERGQVHDVSIAMMLHLIALGCSREGDLYDPRNGSKLKDPATGKQTNRISLAVCVDLCLGRKNAKENDRFRLSYGLLENIPHSEWPEDARQYPVDDAINTLEVAEWQLVNCRNLCDLAAQCETAFGLHLSSMWGMRTNLVKVAALEKILTEQRDLDIKFAVSKKFMREDGSKDMAVIKEAVRAAYLGAPPETEKGAVSTARLTLEDSGNEDLIRLAELSNTERRLKTYLPVLQQAAKGPLNVRANILLANGRVSYEGIIQTYERKGPVRACHEARPGYSWSSVDWSAVEACTLAQVNLRTVGKSRLAEELRSGVDPHALFAAEMRGMDYAEFVAKMKTTPELKDLRQASKAANFGFPGMMGPARFVITKRKEKIEVDGIEGPTKICQLMRTAPRCGEEMITEWNNRPYPPVCLACVKAADTLKKFYLRMWPEMPEYFNWIQIQLEKSDELEQLVSGRVRGGLNAPQAANTLFSGLAADMAKWVLRKMTRECYLKELGSPLYGSRIVLFQHDETILEFPENNLKAPERQAEIHREAGLIYCPDVPVKAEPAIMKVWYKDAATIRNERGELQLWAPALAA